MPHGSAPKKRSRRTHSLARVYKKNNHNFFQKKTQKAKNPATAGPAGAEEGFWEAPKLGYSIVNLQFLHTPKAPKRRLPARRRFPFRTQ